MTWYWFIAFVIMSVFGLLLSASYNRLRADRDLWRREAAKERRALEWLALGMYNTCGAAYPEETDEKGYTPEYFIDLALEAATKEDDNDNG